MLAFWIEQLNEIALAAWPAFVDAAIKGAAVLILVAGLVLILRRQSAALRHLLWTLGMAGLLIMPVLSLSLPGLHVLPQWQVSQAGSTSAANSDMPNDAAGGGSKQPRRQSDVESPSPASSDSLLDGQPTQQTPMATPGPSDSGKTGATRQRTGASSTDKHNAAWTSLPAPTWQAWPLLLAWSIGCLLGLLRLALGTLKLWRLGRHAEPIADAHWQHLVDDLRETLGLSRQVCLLRGPNASMPMTWGSILPGRPARVLLPESRQDWSDDRKRAVLAHELAHVKRRDCLTQMLAQFACALHWFNPLAWLGLRQMKREREQACDDLVLKTGTKASDYAEHVLEVATQLRSTAMTGPTAIAMARKSHLEGRVVAILDHKRNRRALTRLSVAITAILLAAIIVPVAMLEAESDSTNSKQMAENPPSLEQARESYQKVNPEQGAKFGSVAFELNKAFEAYVKKQAPSIGDQTSQTARTPAERRNAEGPLREAQTAFADHIEHQLLPDVRNWLASPRDRSSTQIESVATMLRSLLRDHAKPAFAIGATTDKIRKRYETKIIPSTLAAWRETVDRLDDPSTKQAHLKEIAQRMQRWNLNPVDLDQPWQTTLPNGVTVELAGVAPNPAKGETWWSPDGTELDQPPAEPSSGRVRPEEDEIAREFAIRLTNLEGRNVDTEVAVESSGGGAGGANLGQNQGTIGRAVILPASAKTATVRVGVAAGDWKTLVEKRGTSGGSMGTANHGFAFTQARQADGNLEVTISHDVLNQAIRIVAVDQAGNEHVAGGSRSGSGNVRQITAEFRNVSLDEIEAFRVQVLPYQWVEFRNVSLHAGHKTNVSVQQSGTASDLDREGGSADNAGDAAPATQPSKVNGKPAGRRAAERFLNALRQGDVAYLKSHAQPRPSSPFQDPSRWAGLVRESRDQPDKALTVTDYVQEGDLAVASFQVSAKAGGRQTHRAWVILARQDDGRWMVRDTDDGHRDLSLRGILQNVRKRQRERSEFQARAVHNAAIYDLDESPKHHFLNLDTGKRLAVPDNFPSFLWLRHMGPDLGVEFAGNGMSLVSVDLALNSVSQQEWDTLTAEAFPQDLQGDEPGDEVIARDGIRYHRYDSRPELPMTYSFQTLEGAQGLLQVVEYTEEPRGVKLRYKIFQANSGKGDETTGATGQSRTESEETDHRVYIVGDSVRSGAYTIPEDGLTLRQLVASSAALPEGEDLKGLVVDLVRQADEVGEGEKAVRRGIDLDKLLEGNGEPIQLRPGDVLNVRSHKDDHGTMPDVEALERKALERRIQLAERRVEQLQQGVEMGRNDLIELFDAQLQLLELRVQLARRRDNRDEVVNHLERIVERRTNAHRRIKTLVEVGLRSLTELDEAEADILEAKARLARAKERTSRQPRPQNEATRPQPSGGHRTEADG